MLWVPRNIAHAWCMVDGVCLERPITVLRSLRGDEMSHREAALCSVHLESVGSGTLDDGWSTVLVVSVDDMQEPVLSRNTGHEADKDFEHQMYLLAQLPGSYVEVG
jgi:hypothetical protein